MERNDTWVDFKFRKKVQIVNKLFKNPELVRFDADQLLETAAKKSKLNDYGTNFFLPALEKLCGQLDHFSDFHAFGAFLYKRKIQQQLENRLWATHWEKEYKNEIGKNLPPIILITGLQRSATTYLQRLLGALPGILGLQSKDVVFPVPVTKTGSFPSLTIPKLGLNFLDSLNPELKVIHHIGTEDLEEEVVLMDHSFMTTLEETLFNDSDFGKWVESQDQLPIYQDLKKWLQLILWKRERPERLLLKSPHHMQSLDEFIEVFPNSKIIQMHRNPADAIPSFCSMVFHGKKTFLKGTDPHWIGRHWLNKDHHFAKKNLKTRLSKNHLFLDVPYKQLRNQPLQTLHGILDFCDWPMTAQMETVANDFIQKNKQHRYGKHIYSKKQFGLTSDEINHRFSTYNAKFEGLYN